MAEDSLLLIALILIAVCALGLSWFAGSDAPYIPTHLSLISRILQKAGVKKNRVFYELGSGDGRVVLEAAKLGAKAYGVEQSWVRVWYSRLKAWRQSLPNAYFYHGNIFTLNYYPANIVYIFLLPAGVAKLEKKLKTELKPGALVITQTFHFKSWKPIKKINLTQDQKPISKTGAKPGDFWIYKRV